MNNSMTSIKYENINIETKSDTGIHGYTTGSSYSIR